jgi:hypothetical protein
VSVHLFVPTRVPWVDLAGFRVGVVLWGGLAVLDVGRLAAAPSYAELGAVALLVTVASVGMPTTTGICAAVVGWLLVDGFVEHRYGVLGYDVARDTALLVFLVGLALAVSGTTRSRR